MHQPPTVLDLGTFGIASDDLGIPVSGRTNVGVCVDCQGLSLFFGRLLGRIRRGSRRCRIFLAQVL